jgi:uncharacterized protein
LNEIFTEFKKTYFGETKVFECRLIERKRDEVVILYQISAPAKFVGVSFHSGSKSYGYYWTKRNYNIYHWVDNHKKTIVFYFNISRNTKILERSVEWNDMIVDVAVFPDGKTMILDEDEIPKNMDSNDLKLIENTKHEIFSSLEEIVTQLEERTRSFVRNFS